MVVGWLRICLRLEGVNSLKGKRHLLRGAIERLGREPMLGVAEVGDNDLWGNAELGVTAVASNAVQVERLLAHAENVFAEDPRWEVLSIEREISGV